MALKVLLLRKRLTDAQAENEKLRSELAGFEQREAEISQSIEEASTEEEYQTVSEAMDAFEADRSAAQAALEASDATVADLTRQINEAEEQQRSGLKENNSGGQESRQEGGNRMNHSAAETSGAAFRSRSNCFTTRAAQEAFFKREDVTDFVQRVRDMLGAQPQAGRAVTGAELTIPTVILDLIRDNLSQYSRLIDRVRLRRVGGKARQNVLGEVPEAVWTEMVGVLNEMQFALTDLEVDAYKVGGYVPIPNSYLEDSDLNLGEEVLYMMAKGLGLALDKAIVYGLGGKMPIGFVTRLAETSKPAYWSDTRAPWTDLHSSNVVTLGLSGAAGASFFTPFLQALAKAKPKKDTVRRTWIMNETTRTDLMIKALGFNQAAAIVAGMRGEMPIIGGEIIVLDDSIMADYTIAGGYLGSYLLAERAGAQFGYSDLPMYLQDCTVFKATARYDGQPVFGECFVTVSYNGVAPATTKAFAKDYAGETMNALICTAAASASEVGKTVVTVSGTKADTPHLQYKANALPAGIQVGDKLPAGFKPLVSGTTAIEAVAGTVITVVELDSDKCVVSLGSVTSVPKAAG